MDIGIVFIVFIALLVLGLPVSYCLLFCSIPYLWMHGVTLSVAIQRMAVGPDSFPLLAVPFFILAGKLMNSAGITERIFSWCNKVVGHVTGGLGYANVLASIIFAGMSGTAIADAGGLGAIELEAMKKQGYDDEFSLAITGASSVIGPIIPPSLPAVVLGVMASISVGKIFIGGILPGFVLGAILSVMIYFIARKRKYPKSPKANMKEIWIAAKRGFLPLLAPVIIIGGILAGILTPTEAGIAVVVYSLILGVIYHELTFSSLKRNLQETMNTMLDVIFIVCAANLFGWVLANAQIPHLVVGLFTDHITAPWLAILVMNILLLAAGTFMETISAITILTPVFLPVALAYGMNEVHFAIVMILNLMIGLLTPPVGMVLYVLSGVSKVSFEKIAKAAFPFVLALIVALFIISYVPQIVTWLPNLVFK